MTGAGDGGTTAAGGGDEVARAWDELCDLLREAGATVLRPQAPSDPTARADGFRHLTQLLGLGLDLFVAKADPAFPDLTEVISPTRKWALDNPDSDYRRAPLDGAGTYRIRGQRGTSRLILFDVNAGLTGTRRTRRQLGHLTSDEMEIADDGSFEVIVSAQPHEGNWLPLDPSVTPFDFGLVIRQYHVDRADEVPATYVVERLDGPDRPAPTDPAHVARGLREAGAFVRDSVAYWAEVTDELATAPNQLVTAGAHSTSHAGANPDNLYIGGYWQLDPGEALVIDIDPAPEADFWNLYISNYWWEDIDERHHRMNVNAATAVPRPDGTVRVVIADGDLPVPNHLQTAGNGEGLVLLRLTHPRSTPTVRTRVVPAAEVAALP